MMCTKKGGGGGGGETRQPGLGSQMLGFAWELRAGSALLSPNTTASLYLQEFICVFLFPPML